MEQIVEGRETPKSQRRASFSPIKAIRSLSISSHISTSSDTDLSSPVAVRRRTLRKIIPPEILKKGDLSRKPSRSSAEDTTADHASTSTRPTTPGTGSRGTSISGDFATVIKSGSLQPESSILKASKKEHLVLTPLALMKYRSRDAALQQFPHISASSSVPDLLSPVDSLCSVRDLGAGADVYVPLERVVSAFRDEGTRPSFGIEVWWSTIGISSAFTCMQLDFSLPDDRDEWLKQIRHAVKARARSLPEEKAPADVEVDLKAILELKYKHQRNSQFEIYPVIPRRPYTRLRANSGEVKKTWRDGSSFYVVLSRNSLFLAQFSRSSTGQKVNPSLVQFGLVTLSRVNTTMNDERFDLLFRLPLDQSKKLELSSRYHRTIMSRLLKADAFLKPGWPLWTRREVFLIDGELCQTPLPNGENYGGFQTTLDAFLEGYHCPPVSWTVHWKNVRYPPEFRLLKPEKQSHYSAHQLLAVFRALRFNDFFKSLSFSEIDFSVLSNTSDNTWRLESTVWLSRTGRRSLTRAEFELLENSSVLFQEITALLLGSESVKHIDLDHVLPRESVALLPGASNPPSPSRRICEVMPPIILLLKSLQTRCNSLVLNGNPLGEADVVELSRILSSQPDFMKTLSISRCHLDEYQLAILWDGLNEQGSSIEVIDTSYNSAVEAERISPTLLEATRIRRLNLAYSIKGHLTGPLFRPWSNPEFENPWRLEEVDLSGWKLNFDTAWALMKYLELDASQSLRRLVLNNCGLTGQMVTGILCRVGVGRNMHLYINENPLEVDSTDWIDLIHGNEAPTMLHLNMIQFQHEANFNRLLTALRHNSTIEFLSMVGTGPPARASSKTSGLLFKLFEANNTLKFLDLSGYTGKLEDGQLGWGLSGALGGLAKNTSLRQLRIRNHDIGTAEDLTELCRVIVANKSLCMLDFQQNNLNHHQFSKLAHALNSNHNIISFPWSDSDRSYALQKEKQIFMKHHVPTNKSGQSKLSRSTEGRLNGLLKWLGGHWNSEAQKFRDILARNRENPSNQSLEFDMEYLDSWDDPDLQSWLSSPDPKGKEKIVPRLPASLATSRPRATSVSSDVSIGGNSFVYKPTGMSATLPTYTIREEGSSPSPVSDSTTTRLYYTGGGGSEREPEEKEAGITTTTGRTFSSSPTPSTIDY
ncbi:RNI-like protein [Xylariomycetidae sp. FL2044]|nr:RNI-like protein [Xylariomycetidae sp. FL2044]